MQAGRREWKSSCVPRRFPLFIGATPQSHTQTRGPIVRNRLIPLLLACAAAGCSTYNNRVANIVASRQPYVPENLVDKIDGLYKGIAEPVASRSPLCPDAREGTAEIGDRTLYFALTPSTLFVTPIQPDGLVYTEIPNAKLEGKLENGRLLFSVKNQVCETRYDLRRTL